MDIEERSRFVLTAAKGLFVNGESTEQTVTAAARLADVLDLRAKLSVRALLRLKAAEPTGVEMDRVASVMRAIDELAAGDLKPEEARAEIETASHARPAPTWLFAIAAAAGATALSVIFGVDNFPAAAVIAGSAGMGALLRRVLARVSENVFLQPFCAALLAGVVGALAVRSQLSSSLRLVAVCPCMILLPGPHILNGGLDLIRSRIHLGASRILFALLVVLAIAIGLLCGLALLGVNLPLEPAERRVPLWQDVIAAAVAAAAYGVFFSTPLRMLLWPVAVGALAHALRWFVIAELGFGPAGGAFVACLTVGLILTPVSSHWRMPLAAVGFASVVSMLPGAYLFRTASGLAQIAADTGAPTTLIRATLSDGVVAATVVLAMCLGLLAPKLVLYGLSAPAAPRTAGG